jgi:hypothetical protein
MRGQIIYRDLGRNPVPLVTETFIAAVYTPPAVRSPELCAAVEISDQLISELETAAEYVFGVPMYNFSVPAGFKAYIDQIVLPGRTYTIDESGCKRGLWELPSCLGKNCIVGAKYHNITFKSFTNERSHRIGAHTATDHTVPYGTALWGVALYQALRARLRSYRPSGTFRNRH